MAHTLVPQESETDRPEESASEGHDKEAEVGWLLGWGLQPLGS